MSTLTADAGPQVDSARAVAGRRWRSWRLPAALLAALLLVAVLGVALTARTEGGRLDPRSATPDGSRAVAQVLGDQGVDVLPVDRAVEAGTALDASSGAVVVVGSALLDPDLLVETVSGAQDVVLVTPNQITLDALDAPLATAGVATDDAPTDPGCEAPVADAAGSVSGGGNLYRPASAAGSDVEVCWAPDGEDVADGGAWARWESGGTTYTVVGQPAWLVNESVDVRGNAAVALWSLGPRERLVWWTANPLDALTATGDVAPTDLLPPWVSLVAVQLVLVALVTVVWRARRLGRLVPEPLPVVVRSAETARGRAALYRRAGARDRAGAVLRADVLRRLAPRFGLRPGASGEDVALGAADAAQLPAGDVRHLLLGPGPATDAELVQLSERLDDLVQRIERPR